MSKTLAFCVLVMYGCQPPGCSRQGAMLMKTPVGSVCHVNRGGDIGVCLHGTDLYSCTIENTGCDKFEARCALKGKVHEITTP